MSYRITVFLHKLGLILISLLQVLFDLSELSIQDSLRSEAQRDLARTPIGEKRLIHISYTTISSALSPLYKKHATEIIVEFATLALNVDVKTLLNLRPFMEVLLQRPPPSPAQTGESLLIAPSGASTAAPVRNALALKGMHVVFTVNNVSLDLLQASTADAEGVVLPKAFSLKITDIRADIDMLDLMKADVKLRSLDISDVRDASSHHVFKTIMCPVMDMDQSLAHWRAEALESDALESARLAGEEKQQLDLLQVMYTQSSAELSTVDITVLNITAFVSMDTVMDLINVSLANANAVMSLLAAPAAAVAHVSAAASALTAIDTQKSVDSTFSKVVSAQGRGKGPTRPSSPELKESCNIMNVAVKIINPNLILIDDPTTDKSRAISASCGVDVHYNSVRRLLPSVNVLTNMQNCEVVESLHVSVRNTRVSVLLSMLTRQPQSILEPMGFEVNLRKTSMDNVLLSSVMSLEMDNVKMRVSTKDIALAQSIMTRRVLFEPSAPPREMANTGALEDKTEEIEVQAFHPSSVLSVNMGSFSLVGINDFKGQNVPVVRFTLDDTNYHSESKENINSGEGSLKASAEFYNPQLSLWEPILDQWHPSLSLVTWPLGTVVEITSEATMQLTVSGIMLEKLLQTYSLFFEDDSTAQREEVPGILICNSLGPDIAFDVYDGASGKKLISLENAQIKPVPVPQSSSQSNIRQLSSIADIQFTGEFGAVRDTLRHLPFNLNRPKICNLHVIDVMEERTTGEKFSPTPVLEPIVEEVYENSRYDLLLVRYCAMYQPSDFSDLNSKVLTFLNEEFVSRFYFYFELSLQL
jgi:hypothetical protein